MFRIPLVLSVTSCLLFVISSAVAQPTNYDGYQVVRVEVEDADAVAAVQALLHGQRELQLWSEVLAIGEVDLCVAPESLPVLDATGLCYEVIVDDVQKHIDGLYRSARDGGFFDQHHPFTPQSRTPPGAASLENGGHVPPHVARTEGSS